ncbi:hypothetical protein [Blastococcus goldschmidtiae]|uniref:Uncharacterized protein n=1 Tax=Blastococcus goldschmidtiae TaxID=3075546 RepID=A0ABU2KBM5_9ACTN|nr:hypothetical protein [Blastococcus sp. DSM 46792]MDT0277578.1 hypothetical protein [Blastococcus sp. DSM 46792]
MRNPECPECRWVPVVDGAGRRRLEMRWQLPVSAPAAESLAHAA